MMFMWASVKSCAVICVATVHLLSEKTTVGLVSVDQMVHIA